MSYISSLLELSKKDNVFANAELGSLEYSGLISGKKDILYCVLTRIEIFELKKIVLDEDQSAFITITDISEIIGTHIKTNNNYSKSILK